MAGVPRSMPRVLDATRDTTTTSIARAFRRRSRGSSRAFPPISRIQIVIENGRPQDVICDYANEHVSIASQWAGAVSASFARGSAP